MTKHYTIHKIKHLKHYLNLKWLRFKRQYWKEHKDERYCHICGSKKNIQLHHIYPRHLFPEKIFDENNLIPLCRACHLRFGHLGNFEKYYDPNIKEFAKQTYSRIQKIRDEEK